MEKQVYLTEEERAKCQKVADAFAELYEMENIVVLDVGRYGFIELSNLYFSAPVFLHTADNIEKKMNLKEAVGN